MTNILPPSFQTPAEFEAAVGSSASTLFYAYDAVWALALALNDTLQQLGEEDPSGPSLEEFRAAVDSSPRSQAVGETIRRSLVGVEFEGVSGPVAFQQGSRVLEQIRILQYRNSCEFDNVCNTCRIDCQCLEQACFPVSNCNLVFRSYTYMYNQVLAFHYLHNLIV